jgi:dipeptidyl aminopeptidase/acylaminoacyl peptidase
MHRPLLSLLLGLGVMAAVEAQTPAPDAASALPVPPAMRLENVPPVPAELARRVGPYTEFRGKPFLGWHPQRQDMLLVFRPGNTPQIHRLAKPGGTLEALTDGPDPVYAAGYEPKTGAYLLFQRDTGGNEVTQVYRMDLPGRAVTQLTDANEKHSLGAWNRAENAVVLLSTQLDKTAAQGSRGAVTTEVSVLDPLKPQGRRHVASLPGGGWYGFDWSPNDRQWVAVQYKSATESEVWVMDTASGERRRLFPATDDAPPVSYDEVAWSHDGKGLFLTADREGEFKRLYYYDLASGRFTALSTSIDWDVTSLVLDRSRSRLAFIANEDGRSVLRLLDARRRKMLPPPRLPAGSVRGPAFSRDGRVLAFTLVSARAPAEPWMLDWQSGKLTRWATGDTAGLDTSAFLASEVIRWKSFDGLAISGLMTRPPARFAGPRPVLIDIHGGPEGQSVESFQGRYNYLINELGIVLIEPNVRGSRGYGKRFLSLDNGMLRENSVKDIGALLDWIKTRPELDAGRVMVAGSSYGGYMSLAIATHYPDRIRGAIDTVGISHFVTFLEKTESYRRDLRRVEYGDERDPAMRAFLDRISPLTNAHKIAKPLFVVQGRNDPRVPYQEAEQIVAKARANQAPVWYMIADDEGHGFIRKNNADYLFYAKLRFIEEYLLK